MSYHEFELALKRPARDIHVTSSLLTHYPHMEWLRRLRWPRPPETRYSAFLQELQPHIHRGFFLPNLDLIIKRDAMRA